MSKGLLQGAIDKMRGYTKKVESAGKKPSKKKGETEAERRKRLAKEKRDKKIADEIRAKRNKRKNAPQL